MGSNLLLFVSAATCLAVLSPVADGSFLFKAYPEHIIAGVTSSLTLHCSKVTVEEHAASTVTSLELVRCKDGTCKPEEFILLASTSAGPDGSIATVKRLPTEGYTQYAEASGNIGVSKSYISLVWPTLLMEYEHGFAHSDHGGRYKCVVRVLDKFGHPDMLYDYVDVVGALGTTIKGEPIAWPAPQGPPTQQ